MGTAQLLTATEVRTHIETGITDAALQRILDGVEDDINQRHGAVASQVDDLRGGIKSVWTTRPILTITSVAETVGTTSTTLAADDYDERHGQQLERRSDGTNGRLRWGDRVLITYVPVDTTDRRTVAFLALIQLTLQYRGLASKNAGDLSSSGLNYNEERERLLASLNQPGGFE